ncbi:transglycosylase SLT domain-containing protein [Acidisoma silvae]|uniref:Transglycosylase SLT domain-containing protein n=1 Tax=Acidisoma silvae TaxID=2802396 RepID=A0A963YRU7_9PROT|nr:transglycosylase SLT domain-containing protein [Acidisoma silvae]MCB8875905.1 transglycosylase SLT domain-containing protein [Acidisoma silvae]
MANRPVIVEMKFFRNTSTRLSLALLPFLLCAQAPARAADALPRTCLDAAADAEKRFGIPLGLLSAIGEIESGRTAPSGKVEPWPWTIDANGNSLYLPNLPAAVKALSALQAQGTPMIDVGCFQVDLTYHPLAFATADAAFDPDANATAAARFLSDLHQRLGSWPAAVMSYHSASPAFGIPYRDRVLARWGGAPLDTDNDGAIQGGGIEAEVLVLLPATSPLPHVILPDSGSGTR